MFCFESNEAVRGEKKQSRSRAPALAAAGDDDCRRDHSRRVAPDAGAADARRRRRRSPTVPSSGRAAAGRPRRRGRRGGRYQLGLGDGNGSSRSSSCSDLGAGGARRRDLCGSGGGRSLVLLLLVPGGQQALDARGEARDGVVVVDGHGGGREGNDGLPRDSGGRGRRRSTCAAASVGDFVRRRGGARRGAGPGEDARGRGRCC